MTEDPQAKRRSETSRLPLDEKEVHPSPFRQFNKWYEEALASGIPDANTLVLATSTPDGKPSARVVLLKRFDESGFVFYTNYESRKASELKENPSASLVFYWKELERQVRVEGVVQQISDAESAQYFATRPRESQISAWASRQSTVVPDRDSLERRFRETRSRFNNQEVPLPPFWGGFLLVPDLIEFWQKRENRLHDRIRYRASGGSWIIERLSP